MTDSSATLKAVPIAFETRSLKIKRGQRSVITGLNLKISTGRWCAIIGPNGAGKSSLLLALAGVLPFQGEILLFNQPLRQYAAQYRARRVAWLAQSSVQSADDLTAYDVVMLGRIPYQSWLNGQSQADHTAVEHALKLTHAWDWRNRALGTLSGGEKQRVLLARLLAVEADVLLMDEPFGALDEITRHKLDEDLLNLWQNQGLTIVFVTHSIHEAVFLSNRVVMMAARPGRITEEFKINEPYPRSSEFMMTSDFMDYAKQLQKSLLTASVAG